MSPFHLGPTEGLRQLARTSKAWLSGSRTRVGVAGLLLPSVRLFDPLHLRVLISKLGLPERGTRLG